VATSTRQWLDRFFDWYYRHQPVSATFIGVHEQDGRLPDYSEPGIAAQISEARGLLDDLDTGGVATPDTQWEAIDRLLARNALLIRVWELSDRRVLIDNPCLYTGEATFGIVSLLLRNYVPLDERIESAVSRLRAIPALLEQGKRNVTRCPSAWVAKAIDECDGGIALLTEGTAILASRYGVTRADFHAAASDAVAAYRGYQHYLAGEVAPNTHDAYGISAEPFDRLLQLGHCLDLDGEAVIAYARTRLADARLAMEQLAAGIEPGSDPQTLLARLSDDHPSVGEYDAAYQAEWDRAQAFAVEQDLLTWPDYPISFEPIPDWARAASPHLYFLFYRAPAPFDTHVTQRYLVTPVEPQMPADELERRLRATNRSQIRLNHVIHHGGLGHHVQNWWTYRGASRVGQIAAVDCALRIALLSGGTMAEGWACYAVDLMAEQGYLTPLEQLSQQQGLARMAARAIVDAGLHRGDLSFDDAVAFYRDEAGMSEPAARSETVKNSMFPGAAMMYLLGTDMIRDLRAEMEDRQGSDFSLGRFHDAFLAHGSIPVAVIARLMRGDPIDADGYVSPQLE
jgi:uncharacterized protein (DUF885 family)